MTAAFVRRDSLPEHYSYRDDGCHISPRCLTCPLAVCILDDPSQLQRAAYEARQTERRQRIKALLDQNQNAGPTEIARRLGLSTSTAFRELKGLRA